MSLNVNDAPKGGGNFGHATVGTQVARLCGIADMGIQKREFKGQPKTPCRRLNVTFELCNDLFEYNGEQKPRWISLSINALRGDNSNLTKLANAIDPTGTVYNGDLAAAARAGAPLLVGIEKKDDGDGVKVGTMSGMIPGIQVPPLANVPYVFDMDDPDVEVYTTRLPEWLQKQITEADNFPGSALANALQANAQAAATAQASAPPAQATVTQAPVQAATVAPVATQAAPAHPANIPAAPPGFLYDAATNSYVPDPNYGQTQVPQQAVAQAAPAVVQTPAIVGVAPQTQPTQAVSGVPAGTPPIVGVTAPQSVPQGATTVPAGVIPPPTVGSPY